MIEMDELAEFIGKSGLKKQSVAERLGVPGWVLTKWLRGDTTSYRKKQQELTRFIAEFSENNKYMHQQ